MLNRKALNLALSSIFALSLTLTGCGGSAPESTGSEPKKEAEAAEPITLKLGHVLIPDSERQIISEKIAENVGGKSDGGIKIDIFPQSQLGGEVKMIQSARTGTQDMVITSQAALVNTVSEYGILDIPYLFDSAEQADKVLKGEVGKKLLDLLPQHGLIGLGWTWPNERNVFGNKEIKTAEDLKGAKIRVIQSPGYVKSYEAFGAQPTPMAYSEVYMSLQQGVVDGGDTSPDQFVMDKFYEVSKFYNQTKSHYMPMAVVISKAKWDSMTPEQQKMLQESVNEALEFGVEFNKTYYDQYYTKMKESGVQVVESDVESLKKASEKVHEAILSEIPNGKQWYDEIQAAKQK